MSDLELLDEPREHGDIIVERDTGQEVIFDVTISRDKEWSADVPTKVVEEGYPITYAVSPNEPGYTSEVMISKTPVFLDDRSINRDIRAFEKIRDIFEGAKQVDLITERGVYEVLAISGFSESQDSDTGQSIVLNIDFTPLNIVQSNTVTVPPEKLAPSNRSGAQSETDKGKKSADVASDEESSKIDQEREDTEEAEESGEGSGPLHSLFFGRDEPPGDQQGSPESVESQIVN